MVTFLHAADLHLDSPLKGLERYEGAPVDEIRQATRRALQNLVNLALERTVDFLILAGDLYDGDWKDHNTGLFFVAQMARLREAGIPVVAISGNHDAANKMTRSLHLPDNVELLPATHAATARADRLRELGMAVHGRSFAKPNESDNLMLSYPPKIPGMFNIGVLHTSLAGAEGHAPYAPCSLHDLRSKEYDYWALGHVHQSQIVCQQPWVVFPGNCQGRHIREPGVRGCYLVHVDDRGTAQLEFQSLDVFRWATCVVSAEPAERIDDLLSAVTQELTRVKQAHEGLPLAVRVLIAGSSPIHEQLAADPPRWTQEIRSSGLQAGGGVWIEKVLIRTTPCGGSAGPAVGDGPLGDLLQYFDALQQDDAQLQDLAGELEDLARKLPDELRQSDDGVRPNDPQWVRELLDTVRPLLVHRLRGESPR